MFWINLSETVTVCFELRIKVETTTTGLVFTQALSGVANADSPVWTVTDCTMEEFRRKVKAADAIP